MAQPVRSFSRLLPSSSPRRRRPRSSASAQALPASVANNAHPSAVALGQPNNPIAASNRPATARDQSRQARHGRHARLQHRRRSRLQGCQSRFRIAPAPDMAGNGALAVKGVKLGVAGGTGPLNSTGKVAGPVNLGQNQPPPMPKPQAPSSSVARSRPQGPLQTQAPVHRRGRQASH